MDVPLLWEGAAGCESVDLASLAFCVFLQCMQL